MNKKNNGRGRAGASSRAANQTPSWISQLQFRPETFRRNLRTLRKGMDNLGTNVKKSVTLMDAVLTYLDDTALSINPSLEQSSLGAVEEIKAAPLVAPPAARYSSLAQGIVELLHTPPFQEILGELAKTVKKRSGESDFIDANPSVVNSPSVKPSPRTSIGTRAPRWDNEIEI